MAATIILSQCLLLSIIRLQLLRRLYQLYRTRALMFFQVYPPLACSNLVVLFRVILGCPLFSVLPYVMVAFSSYRVANKFLLSFYYQLLSIRRVEFNSRKYNK